MGSITGTYKGKTHTYDSWDDVLYKSESGGYKIKASAARRGVTMASATKAFGAPPSNTTGVNPNVEKNSAGNYVTKPYEPPAAPNNALVTPTSSTTKAPTNTSSTVAIGTVMANSGGGGNVMWDGKGWVPTNKAVTTPSSNGSNYSLQNNSSSGYGPEAQAAYNALMNAVLPGANTREVKEAIARAAADKVDAAYKADPNKAAADAAAFNKRIKDEMEEADRQARIQWAISNPGVDTKAIEAYEAAKKKFANDPKALDAFTKSYNEGKTMVANGYRSEDENLRNAISQGDRWVNDPFRFLTEPLDNLVNGSPVAAAVAQNGVGVTAGAAAGGGVAAHLGSGMPATPTGSQNINQTVDDAVKNANLPQVQMPTNQGTYTPNNGNLNIPPSNNLGYTPINVTTGQPSTGTSVGTTPIGTPAGAALGASPTNPTVTGSTNTPTSTGGGNAPTGTTTTPAAGTQTGTPVGTTPTTNWWDAIGAKEALAAAGIVVGAGGSLIAANTAANGQTEAARIQAEAAQKAIDAQKAMYDQTRLDQQPWREAGQNALGHLSNWDAENPAFSFNTDPSKGVVDPSYSWRLSEGIKALENSAAGRGTLKSGNTLKAITEYGQGAASQEYSNAYNRYMTTTNQKMNRLQSLAGIGQTAVNTTGQAGQNYTNNATNALIGGAQAQAQGQAGAANAWAQGGMGAVNSLINGLSEYYQNNQRQNILNALKY